MKQDKLSWARLVSQSEAKQLPLLDYLLERSAAQLETDQAAILAKMDAMLQVMEEDGYKGGRVHITHGLNPTGAQALRALIAAKYPQADITVGVNTGLCTFYAEKGGIMVGFSDL